MKAHSAAPAEPTVAEAERALADFVRLASHELRGPLATISLASEVLLSSNEIRAGASHLKTIDRCVARISALLDTLVQLVMIEHEGLLLCKEQVDAQALVDRAISAGVEAARRKGVEITTRVPAHRVVAVVDPARMTQAFGDLIRLALVHSGKAGIEVRLQERPGALVFSVETTGMTIASDQLASVFARAWRGPSGQGALEMGAAMALAIARHHGGSAEVLSEGGQSRFQIVLPHPVL